MILIFAATFLLLLQPSKSDKSENISDSTISESLRVNHTRTKAIMTNMERDDWPQKEIFAILGISYHSMYK